MSEFYSYLLYLVLYAASFLFLWLVLSTFWGKMAMRNRVHKQIIRKQKQKKRKAESEKPSKKRMALLYAKIENILHDSSIPITPGEFFRILLFGNMLILFLGWILGIIWGICLFSFFNGIIYFFLKTMQERRKRKMADQLPDVLLLISNSLKTGYSIFQSIELIAKEEIDPLSEEFENLVQALRIGEKFDVAFTQFAERLQIPEITTVVDIILITRETGGNMTQVIDGVIEMMQENQQLKGEIKAISAQGRISAWVVGSLPTGLFLALYWISTDYINNLFNHPLGYVLIVVAVFLQVIGIVLINKIVKIKI